MVQSINDYTPQQIAVALWAFAKLETGSRTSLMQVTQAYSIAVSQRDKLQTAS